MQHQRAHDQREAAADPEFGGVRRGPLVSRDRRQRERRGSALATRTRKRNDVAEIGRVGLRGLVAARDQDGAVEVFGAALVLHSLGDDVAWLWKLPHRHALPVTRF